MAKHVETVLSWSGGRRLHLLTAAPISSAERAAIEAAMVRISDIDAAAEVVARILGHTARVQRWEAPTVDFSIDVG